MPSHPELLAGGVGQHFHVAGLSGDSAPAAAGLQHSLTSSCPAACGPTGSETFSRWCCEGQGGDCTLDLLGNPMGIASVWCLTLILIKWITSKVGHFIVMV